MEKDLIPIKKDNHDSMMSCCSDGEYYPYGTSLDIDGDLIESLGIGELITDDVVEIRAVGFVNSKHETSYSGDEEGHKSMGIQITDLKIKRKAEEDLVKQLYKG